MVIFYIKKSLKICFKDFYFQLQIEPDLVWQLLCILRLQISYVFTNCISIKWNHQTKSDAEIYISSVQESLAYPLVSFVAEFGGTLGLFLGFSFMRLVNRGIKI